MTLMNDVATWIVRLLQDGPRPSSEIVRDAMGLGYNEKTVRRAVAKLVGSNVVVSERVSEKDMDVSRPNARQYRLSQVTHS